MVPHIIFTRRNVQVTDQDRLFRRIGPEMVAHFGEVIELLAELHIFHPVGNVTPGGDVEIMDRHAVFQPPGDVAGMTKGGEIMGRHFGDRQFRQDGDAVVAFLAARHDMGVAKVGKSGQRHQVHRAFAFLQAQDIGPLCGHQARHQPLAQAHRIDVPGGKGKAHRGILRLRRHLAPVWLLCGVRASGIRGKKEGPARSRASPTGRWGGWTVAHGPIMAHGPRRAKAGMPYLCALSTVS